MPEMLEPASPPNQPGQEAKKTLPMLQWGVLSLISILFCGGYAYFILQSSKLITEPVLPPQGTRTAVGMLELPLAEHTKEVRPSQIEATLRSGISTNVTPTPTILSVENIAPKYEEIKDTILSLRGDNALPITQEQRKQLDEFRASLTGKQVNDWVGWVSTITPNKELLSLDDSQLMDPVPRPDLTAWISMDDPCSEEGRYTELRLYGLSAQQASSFETWGLNEKSCTEKARFNGVILGVYDTTVLIEVSYLEVAR